VQRVLTAPFRFAAGRADLKDFMNLPAGSGSGMIHDLPPAGDLCARLAEETVLALQAIEKTVTYAV
jgi:hypothetical protein